MNKDERIQVKLASGSSRMTAWVDKEVKVAQQVTLKDSDEPNRWWTVLEVNSKPTKASDIKTNRSWKVGGF